jgi:carboxylate-amine ligase
VTGTRDVLTMGVEEEFLLVDATGRLAADGPAVSENAEDDAVGQTEHELRRCQVESATGVCRKADELVDHLGTLRDRLAGEAAARGLRLLPSGSAPLAEDASPRFTPEQRYQRMEHEFGSLADESLTCACHVHIGIPDRADGLTISNGLRPWLPVLLALSANSPFHQGTDTRYASWRHLLWKHWPSAGPPPHFTSIDQYESAVDGILRSGAIIDRGMIYWDVRLSDHEPTVEIRIADVAASVPDAALLAVLVRAIAGRALDGFDDAPDGVLSQEVLRARLWRSARDGLAGRCVDPRSGDPVPAWDVIDDLVAGLGSYLRATDDADFVAETLARLRGEGGGAQRQRAAFERRGRLDDVVDDLAWPVPNP